MSEYPTPVISKEGDIWDESRVMAERVFKLNDGRPVLAQTWKEAEDTYITYFLPRQDIDFSDREALKEYLIKNGLDIGADEAYQLVDNNGIPCWGITVMAGCSGGDW